MADECSLDTYTYSITFPFDESSPPEIFLSVVFNCNGVTYSSPSFDSSASAFGWANTELASFGTWTLDGNTLTLSESLCENGSLGYRMMGAVDVYGCTNINSSNFNADATIDDGSCVPPVADVVGCMNPSATNYNPNATIDSGCIFSNSNVTFNLAAKKTIETKIGANIFESDVNSLASWQADAITLALQTYYFTPSGTMNNSNATKLNNFLSAVGASVGVYYSIQSNSVLAAFPTLIDWLVSKFNPVFVQLDQESQSGAGITDAQYISRAQQVIAHIPTIQTSWDTAPIWKSSGASRNRNLALAPLTDTNWGRQYSSLHDNITFITGNQDQNLIYVNNYYDSLIPSYTTNFFDFPQYLSLAGYNYKWILEKINVVQWKNTQSIPISDILQNYAIARQAIFTLQNTERFAYLFWMTSSTIFNQTVKLNAFKRIVPCFKYQYVVPITLPFDGLIGVGFYNGANGYAMLIVNMKSTEQTITAANIQISGKTVSGNFTVNSGYADDFYNSQQDQIVSTANITIKKCSSNLITFTAT